MAGLVGPDGEMSERWRAFGMLALFAGAVVAGRILLLMLSRR